MSRPQQPELHRSGNVPALDPDATESDLEGVDRPENEGETGPVPAANQPGSGSGPTQDKPDVDDFVERFSQGAGSGDDPVTAQSGRARSARRIMVVGAGLVAVVLVVRRLRRRDAK